MNLKIILRLKFFAVFILISSGCNSNLNLLNNIINKNWYTHDDILKKYTYLNFRIKNDSLIMNYDSGTDDGNYLNGCVEDTSNIDLSNYAFVGSIKNLKIEKNFLKLKTKNCRTGDLFNLELSLDKSNEKLIWLVSDSSFFDICLPSQARFEQLPKLKKMM